MGGFRGGLVGEVGWGPIVGAAGVGGDAEVVGGFAGIGGDDAAPGLVEAVGAEVNGDIVFAWGDAEGEEEDGAGEHFPVAEVGLGAGFEECAGGDECGGGAVVGVAFGGLVGADAHESHGDGALGETDGVEGLPAAVLGEGEEIDGRGVELAEVEGLAVDGDVDAGDGADFFGFGAEDGDGVVAEVDFHGALTEFDDEEDVVFGGAVIVDEAAEIGAEVGQAVEEVVGFVFVGELEVAFCEHVVGDGEVGIDLLVFVFLEVAFAVVAEFEEGVFEGGAGVVVVVADVVDEAEVEIDHGAFERLAFPDFELFGDGDGGGGASGVVDACGVDDFVGFVEGGFGGVEVVVGEESGAEADVVEDVVFVGVSGLWSEGLGGEVVLAEGEVGEGAVDLGVSAGGVAGDGGEEKEDHGGVEEMMNDE